MIFAVIATDIANRPRKKCRRLIANANLHTNLCRDYVISFITHHCWQLVSFKMSMDHTKVVGDDKFASIWWFFLELPTSNLGAGLYRKFPNWIFQTWLYGNLNFSYSKYLPCRIQMISHFKDSLQWVNLGVENDESQSSKWCFVIFTNHLSILFAFDIC